MLDFLTDLFTQITFIQALVCAFILSILFWASLWGHEAQIIKKRSEGLDILRGYFCESFEELDIPIAYFEAKSLPYVNNLFLTILNIQSFENLSDAIVNRLSKYITIESWDEFVHYLAFQSKNFMVVLESEGQSYCLHARSMNDIVYMWMDTLKTSDDTSIYTKRIIDNVPIALWYRNVKGDIEYCNQIYAKSFDKSSKDVIKENLELIPRQQRNSPYQLSQKAVENGDIEISRSYSVIGGSRRFLELGVVPFRKGDSLSYAIDVTEIEHLQNEIKKQTEAHQELLHNMSTGIAIYGQDTRLNYFNQAYLKFFQFDENWLLTKPTLGDILEDLRSRRKLQEYPNFQAHKKDRLQLFKTIFQPIEELAHQPDGRILRVVLSPHKLGGLVYLFEDVSEKLGLETQYNTLIAVQKETIDNLFESILVFGSDNRLQIMNQSFCKMRGIQKNEIFLGKTIQECLRDPSFFESQSDDLLHIFMTTFHKRHPFQHDITLKNKHVLRCAYVPLPDGSHLLSFMDITDTTRFQEALKERNRMLEEVDGLKSRFIKHVSYELKTPISIIQNHAEKMQLHTGKGAENDSDRVDSKESSKEIIASTNNLLSVINDMLDLASLESGQLTLMPENVYISKFLKSIVSLVSRRAKERGVEIKLTNTTHFDDFLGDEKRLKQALFNILANTIKYKRTSGLLAFDVGVETINHHEFIHFSITDKAFSVRKLKKNVRKESALNEKKKKESETQDLRTQFVHELGFSLVKRIVELHGGWITFDISDNAFIINEAKSVPTKNMDKEEAFGELSFSCYIPRFPIETENEVFPLLKVG